MTGSRLKGFLVAAALMTATAGLGGCAVHHDPYYGHGHGYRTHGVYHASPRYQVRRSTHYYRSPSRHDDHRDHRRHDNDRDDRRDRRDSRDHRDDRRDDHRDWN